MKNNFMVIVIISLFFSTSAMADFVDNGDGTVTDTATGLMWQQNSAGPMTWQAALNACESLFLAGHDDWRLPNINELKSIIDYARYAPSIDTRFFPDTQADRYWSSTTYTPDPALAWNVYFDTGTSGGQRNKSDALSVRAVRGGEAVTVAVFSGELTTDVRSGLAPAEITFQTFVSQGSPPFTYAYDFGDGTTATGKQKTAHTYQEPGNYIATVTVRDNAGVVIQSQTTILVTEPSRITDLTDILQADADEMANAVDGQDVSRLLKDGENIIQQSLEPIVNAEETFKTSIQASVQSGTQTLVGNTVTRLNTLIQEGKVTEDDLDTIVSGLSDVTSNMVRNEVPVPDQTVNDLKSVSGTIYTQTLDTILQNEALPPDRINTIKTDKAAARTFFRNKPYLLDDVTDKTGIQVDTTTDFNPEKVTARAAQHRLTDIQTGKLYTAVEPTPDIARVITSSPDIDPKTIVQIAEEIYETHMGRTVTDTILDDIARNLLLAFSDGSHVSFIVRSVRIVNDYMPKGLFDLPNGNKLGVTDTYALEFTSYPVFPHTIASDVIKLGIDPVIQQDGGLRLQLDHAASLSLKPGWVYFKSNTFDSLTTSFSVVGGSNPAAEAYALLVTYDTGFNQLLPPSIMALKALTDALDAIVPGDYRVDTDTGVISLGALQLKPDYVFTSTSKIDYTAISKSGGFVHNNLAFEFTDANKDGVTDIVLHSESPMGHQVLYVVP